MTSQETRAHLLERHGFAQDYVRKSPDQRLLNWHKREHKAGVSQFSDKHTHAS